MRERAMTHTNDENEVSTCDLVDAKPGPSSRRRRRWSVADKRRLVAETLAPGSSVSMVSRRYDVNANQLFRWRREQQAGPSGNSLLPVEIVDDGGRDLSDRDDGTIEIVLAGGTQVRVCGVVAPVMLRRVLSIVSER
jgi:transposase